MSERFTIEATPLSGVAILQRRIIGDERGFLERIYCFDDLKSVLEQRQIAQINHTKTKNIGVIRGMHFQHPPHAETKIVTCLHGEVFDVAVDLRKDSPTFMQWFGTHLSATNFKSLLIPEGFAHGFQTLATDSELLYLHTHAYYPESEDGVDALDAELAIEWPLPIAGRSERDKQFTKNNFMGIEL